MNRILFLSGSPKYKDSCSEHYLELLETHLNKDFYIEEEKMLHFNDHVIEKIGNADIIVISSPLYADSLPSHVINFLINMSSLDLTNKSMYAIINCGFLEGIHNIVSLEILSNYCDANKMEYMGGLGIGGGPVGYQHKLYNYPIFKCIKALANKINYKESYFNNYTCPLIPRFIYIGVANYRWGREIKSLKN